MFEPASYYAAGATGETLLQTPPQVFTHLPKSPTTFIPSPQKFAGPSVPTSENESCNRRNQPGFSMKLMRTLTFEEAATPSTASSGKKSARLASGALLNPNVTPFNYILNDQNSTTPQPFAVYNPNREVAPLSNEELLKRLNLSGLKVKPNEPVYSAQEVENIQDPAHTFVAPFEATGGVAVAPPQAAGNENFQPPLNKY